jgi:long-chain fatty acid transport protein
MRIDVKNSLLALLAFAVATIFGSMVFATDGYLSHGCSIQQQGGGGAGAALPENSLAACTNPAGMVFVGTRFDFGMSLFRPIRSATIVGNQLPPGYPDVNGTYDASRQSRFYIPELGYNHMLGDRMSLGVSMYGNGGMNTSYFKPIPLLGTSRPGVDLQQLFIAPTFAAKLNRRNAVGVSLNIAYQRFRADGLENFASPAFSIDPTRVTNRGYDSSEGVGVRVGWLGEVTPAVTVDATYQTRTWMGRFNQYRGLFAEQGRFDIPANFAGGVAVKVGPKATVALDVERILYGQVKSIANSGSNAALLGSNNGPGFGWQDVTAPKVGIEYQLRPSLTLRGGYNHSGVPFAGGETFFNILAPGVVQNHVTAGASWGLRGGRQISLAYLHAFERTVNGASSIPAAAGGGNANLRMYEDSIGLSFGWIGE